LPPDPPGWVAVVVGAAVDEVVGAGVVVEETLSEEGELPALDEP
jgi:hypothetical protein